MLIARLFRSSWKCHCHPRSWILNEKAGSNSSATYFPSGIESRSGSSLVLAVAGAPRIWGSTATRPAGTGAHDDGGEQNKGRYAHGRSPSLLAAPDAASLQLFALPIYGVHYLLGLR